VGGQVCGFDLLEDEAVVDHHVMDATDLLPRDWIDSGNPGFTYYSYYIYANLVSLNHLRRYDCMLHCKLCSCCRRRFGVLGV